MTVIHDACDKQIRSAFKSTRLIGVRLRAVIIPRLHDQTLIKQTSSKRRTNIEQLEHTSCTCILNAFAGCLLDDYSMFA